MDKRILILFFFLISSSCAFAQKDFEYVDSSVMYGNETQHGLSDNDEAISADEAPYTADTTVSFRTIPNLSDTVAMLKARKDFAYAKNLDSLLRTVQKQHATRNTSPERNTFFDGLFSSGIFKFILWTLAGLFIAYILSKLFLNKGLFVRSAKNKVIEVVPTEDELFLQQNFDQLIHQSYKLGDYKVAVRYLFLKTLRQLSDKSFIAFGIDKTNSRYLNEIPSQRSADFAELIRQYEYIWYGNFPIDQQYYAGLESKFTAFLQKI